MAGLRHSILTFCKAETSAMVASVADFGLTVLLTEVVGVWYAYAILMGAVTGAVINCCVNYRWVFSAAGLSKCGVALRYLAVWIGSIALNTTGTYLLTELTGINYIISKIVVACLVATLWNYQMQRVYVFQSKRRN